jgi:phosphoglycolate phosphatase-like HAD superfamily hydrolase
MNLQPKPTLVLFDVDGTLVYSEKRDSQCFAHTYEQVYGRPFPSIDWLRYPHVSDTTIFEAVIREHFDRELEVDEIAQFETHYLHNLQAQRDENPHLFLEVPGAKAVLDILLSHPAYLVAVATGGWARSAKLKLRHVGIDPEAFVLIGADERPTREIILNDAIAAVKKQALHFERVVYVGDAIWDVRTTRNLKMDFLGLRLWHDYDFLEKMGVAQVIGNYLDFELFTQKLHLATPPAAYVF